MKKYLHVLLVFLSFVMINCKSYSLNSIPYVLSGSFMMEADSEDYSICGVDFYLKNKSKREIKKINIIFYLFDSDGEPACECPNKINVEIEKSVPAESDWSFCMSLDGFMNTIPSDYLCIDYLYISRIDYEDGSVWEDPYGIVAFQ